MSRAKSADCIRPARTRYCSSSGKLTLYVNTAVGYLPLISNRFDSTIDFNRWNERVSSLHPAPFARSAVHVAHFMHSFASFIFIRLEKVFTFSIRRRNLPVCVCPFICSNIDYLLGPLLFRMLRARSLDSIRNGKGANKEGNKVKRERQKAVRHVQYVTGAFIWYLVCVLLVFQI